MTKMKQQLCAGLRVDAHPAKVSSVSTQFYFGNEPPHVTLRQIGGTTITLTPAEARQVASMLTEAANTVEPVE